MSEERGTAATSEATIGSRGSLGSLALAVAAVSWLAAMLWSARASITTREAAEMEVTSTAYALPGIVAASLVAGAAVALAVLALLARGTARGATAGGSATARFTVAVGAGLATGLLAALSVLATYAQGWLYAVVAGTVAAAATIGGAVAAVRVPRVVAAGAWAGLVVFVLGVGLNLFVAPLLDLFGAGPSLASQQAAVDRFWWTQALLSGLGAGVVAFAALRLARRPAGADDVGWPLYAAAGAGPGLLLLITEALIRTAGSRVLQLAGKVSELELAGQTELAGRRLNAALVIVFVGAVTAIVAVGRTLRPAADDPS